jgi:hypothetical protein
LKIRRNNKELMEIDNDKSPPVVINMTDCAGLQYDWRLRLSRLNMTDFDLTKYDWRRRECGGGSGDYCEPVKSFKHVNVRTDDKLHNWKTVAISFIFLLTVLMISKILNINMTQQLILISASQRYPRL